MLEKNKHFNDLSPALRKKLEDKITSFGAKVKYKFAISSINPDPQKYNGPLIWPSIYTLDPIVFDIIDPEEKREGVSKQKKIGIVIGTDSEGMPNDFQRVRVHGRHEGNLDLDLEKSDDIEVAAIIELHPKLEGGLFQDKKRVPVISRVDEAKEAKEGRQKRSEKALALRAAEEMTDAEVREFAASMVWDENADINLLRNRVEEMAEASPKMFSDKVAGKQVAYQSAIKRALDKEILSYDPNGHVFKWKSTGQTITVLGEGDMAKNHIERMGEFLMGNGKKGEEVYAKLGSLLKS